MVERILSVVGHPITFGFAVFSSVAACVIGVVLGNQALVAISSGMAALCLLSKLP